MVCLGLDKACYHSQIDSKTDRKIRLSKILFRYLAGSYFEFDWILLDAM